MNFLPTVRSSRDGLLWTEASKTTALSPFHIAAPKCLTKALGGRLMWLIVGGYSPSWSTGPQAEILEPWRPVHPAVPRRQRQESKRRLRVQYLLQVHTLPVTQLPSSSHHLPTGPPLTPLMPNTQHMGLWENSQESS